MALDEPRPNATDIYERVRADGEDELSRPASALAFSGLFSGFTLGISGLGMAAVLALLGDADHHHVVAALMYPIGFIAVIVGRAQLFTENTLYPVVVALEKRRYFGPMLRLWAIVLVTNLVGAAIFALIAVKTGALKPEMKTALEHTGTRVMDGPWWTNFWSAVLAGWLIALVAWLVEGSEHTTGRVLVIFLITYVIGVAGFDHIVASASEVMSTVFSNHASAGSLFAWLAAAALGNTVGGVAITTLLNIGQVRSGQDDDD